ncbi:hypothetical protein F4780DRAFT_727106 [Xylariomycetidae sp. FL0641]|nr:hypothetical protein F4780DRAFT_727106 [Xylariomycetidae sp. FL0641]
MASNESSIAAAASSCIELFQDLLGTQEREDRIAIRNQAWEEYGRLKIWCDENRAIHPDQARGSLAEFLRGNDRIRDSIIDIFQQMQTFLRLAVDFDQGSHTITVPDMEVPVAQYSDDSQSDENSEDGSSDSEDSDDENSSPEASLTTYLHHVSSKVELLYELNSLLRRPGLGERYLRSRGSISSEVHSNAAERVIPTSLHVRESEQQPEEQSTSSPRSEVTKGIQDALEAIHLGSSARGPLERQIPDPVNTKDIRETNPSTEINTDRVPNRPESNMRQPSHEPATARGIPNYSTQHASRDLAGRATESMRPLDVDRTEWYTRKSKSPPSSEWLWKCCECGAETNSYMFNTSCTDCLRSRCLHCVVWASK